MNLLRRAKRAAYNRLHDLSLTTRLVTVVVVLALSAYVVTTALTLTMLRDYMIDRVDADLDSYIAPLGQTAYDQLTGARGQPFVPDELIPQNQPYYVLVTHRYTPHAFEFQFPEPSERKPALDPVAWDDPLIGQPFTVAGSDDPSEDWRVLVRRLGTGDGTVAVATPLTRVENTVGQLATLITIVGFCTLLAVALVSWFAVRRAFRPLTRIEDTARAIAAGDLTKRVPPRNATDEVASLSESLNTMLTRIEHSFAAQKASESRMRQFVADASHELRTPLATVRGYAELYRFGGVRTEEDVTAAMRRIEDEASRMGRLVEDLLLLTRLDSQPSFERAPVDLTVLAADTVQDARVRAPQRSIRLVNLNGRASPVMTTGDDHALRQVLANLVTNALSHTPEDTPVEIALGEVDRKAVLEVRDHGPGIHPDMAGRVFERFYRADPSRSRARGGTGLGLAIVAAIVERHRGSVQHRPTPGGGATFRVEFPMAPSRTVAS